MHHGIHSQQMITGAIAFLIQNKVCIAASIASNSPHASGTVQTIRLLAWDAGLALVEVVDANKDDREHNVVVLIQQSALTVLTPQGNELMDYVERLKAL